MKITLDELFCQDFGDRKIIDLSEFKSIHTIPKVDALQNYFDKCSNSIKMDKGFIECPLNGIPTFLEDSFLDKEEDRLKIYLGEEFTSDYRHCNIAIKYNEYYEYGEFDEYNLDSDTLKSISEYENIEACLSSQQDCSYISSYSFCIYLEIEFTSNK